MAHDGGQFCREIQRIIDLPVEIENISNALAIAEMRFGAARDVADFTLVHVTTFVGAGIVSDSKLVRGDTGVSGRLDYDRFARAAEQSGDATYGRYNMVGNVWELTCGVFKVRSLKKVLASAHTGKKGYKLSKGESFSVPPQLPHRGPQQHVT